MDTMENSELEVTSETCKQSIQTFLSVKDKPKKTFNIKVTYPKALTVDALADMFAKMEEKNQRVGFLFMNAGLFNHLRKWGRDTMDMEDQAPLLKAGLFGTLWGAQIFVTEDCEDNTVYLAGDDFLIYRFNLIFADLGDKDQRVNDIFTKVHAAAYSPSDSAWAEVMDLIRKYREDFIFKATVTEVKK